MNLAKLQDTKSIQKSLAFQYTNDEKSGREIKGSISFTIATKIIKYLGINLPKETKELYTENPKDSIRKLLELISEFSKIAGYKINTQKSLAFPYTNNEKSEREVKKSIISSPFFTFTIATKRIKYLGIYLFKDTKELYMEN